VPHIKRGKLVLLQNRFVNMVFLLTSSEVSWL